MNIFGFQLRSIIRFGVFFLLPLLIAYQLIWFKFTKDFETVDVWRIFLNNVVYISGSVVSLVFLLSYIDRFYFLKRILGWRMEIFGSLFIIIAWLFLLNVIFKMFDSLSHYYWQASWLFVALVMFVTAHERVLDKLGENAIKTRYIPFILLVLVGLEEMLVQKLQSAWLVIALGMLVAFWMMYETRNKWAVKIVDQVKIRLAKFGEFKQARATVVKSKNPVTESGKIKTEDKK